MWKLFDPRSIAASSSPSRSAAPSCSATVTGTWTADTSTEPGVVSLEQEEPYEAKASGIFAVDGAVLTYEVVQTEPDYGFSPPTPQGGFGSTNGPGVGPGDNVQTFRRAQ